MRKFRFKFASILKLRKIREDEALRLLGDAQRLYQTEIARKSQLVASLGEALIRRELLGRESTDILAFKLEDDFIVGTKQRIVQADQAILRASRGVEKALRAYLYTRRQTRMMETIRDKAYSEFRKSEARRELRELDEMTIMRERMREALV